MVGGGAWQDVGAPSMRPTVGERECWSPILAPRGRSDPNAGRFSKFGDGVIRSRSVFLPGRSSLGQPDDRRGGCHGVAFVWATSLWSCVSTDPKFDGSGRFEMHGSWVPSVHLLDSSTPVIPPSHVHFKPLVFGAFRVGIDRHLLRHHFPLNGIDSASLESPLSPSRPGFRTPPSPRP